MRTAFFAYPYKPNTAETIKFAIDEINKKHEVSISTWQELSITGRILIDVICQKIDACDFFCADLTELNLNVLFELGYAISKKKRIWLIRDTSTPDYESNFRKLKLLTTIGYAEYTSSRDIIEAYNRDLPHNDVFSNVFDESIEPSLNENCAETVLYLKSKYETDPCIAVTNALINMVSGKEIDLITDDPSESSTQPLSWYGVQVFRSSVVICHFINKSKAGSLLHNARYSLVSGLAMGMHKHVRMLIHEEEFGPADYRDILHVYHKSTELSSYIIDEVLPYIESASHRNEQYRATLSHLSKSKNLSALRVGEWVAENEERDLIDKYFCETRDFHDACEGRKHIFIGRKGSGKTAMFLKLNSQLRLDKRNFVSNIKPLTYQLHRVIEVCQRYKFNSVEGNAIESLWKSIIYTEIIKDIYQSIESRENNTIHPEERGLYDYANKNPWVLGDFSERLNRGLESLMEKGEESGNIRLSEDIHRNFIPNVRKFLYPLLSKKKSVFMLVDNLDKAWDKNENVKFLSEFLIGLLAASVRISEDFRNHIDGIDFNIVIFLRQDIYRDAIRNAREPDKIDFSIISWEDETILIRLAQERMTMSLDCIDRKGYYGDIWNDFFCSTVNGISTRDYILGVIIHRPRDLLYFLDAAIKNAVNRRHAYVEADDILAAEEKYSEFAMESLSVELATSFNGFENFSFELLGSSSTISHGKIVSLLKKTDEYASSDVLDLLIQVGFIEIQVGETDFRSAWDAHSLKKARKLGENYSDSKSSELHYRICRAYWSFLEIT